MIEFWCSLLIVGVSAAAVGLAYLGGGLWFTIDVLVASGGL